MKYLFSVVALLITYNLAQANEPVADKDIAAIVGEIILYEDYLDRFSKRGSHLSAEKHLKLVEDGLAKIQSKYQVQSQVDYLWTVMVRSGFSGQYAESFVDLVRDCCNKEFIAAIDAYMDQEYKYDKSVTHKAKYVRHYLLLINENRGEK